MRDLRPTRRHPQFSRPDSDRRGSLRRRGRGLGGRPPVAAGPRRAPGRHRRAGGRRQRGRRSTRRVGGWAPRHAGCACSAGAQCADTSRLWLAATAAMRIHSVMPAHRETSACTTSTAPAVHIRWKYDEVVAVLPCRDVGTNGRAHLVQAVEIVRGDRLFEPGDVEVGESAVRRRMACLRVYPPLASTNSSGSGPIASRTSAMRSRSRCGSAPHAPAIFILTRGMPCVDCPGAHLGHERDVVERGEAAGSVDRDRVAHLPEERRQCHVGAAWPSRSQSAMSTAAIAIDTTPGRPALRMARTIACPGAGDVASGRGRARRRRARRRRRLGTPLGRR